MELERKEYEISASAFGKIVFDQIIFYTLEENEESCALCNLFDSKSIPPTITYEKVNPTFYKLHIKTEKPFFLLFSEAYSPLWKAQIEDGQEIPSTIAYSMINCFYVNRTGEFNVNVYFVGQACADLGLKISCLSLIIVVVVVVIPKKLTDRIKRKFAVWRKSF